MNIFTYTNFRELSTDTNMAFASGEDGSITSWQRFVYRGYLQIAAFDVNSVIVDEEEHQGHSLATTTFWDPMEPTATRPLAITDHSGNTSTTYFHTHDLTKNVCELLDSTGTIITSYDYTPFGAVTASNTTTPNTFMFSSEVLDPETSLIYYNFRHYNPTDGRWVSRDPIREKGGINLYGMLMNNLVNTYDRKGLVSWNPLSWNWSEIGSDILEIIDDSANAVVSGVTCAVKYTYEFTIYMPVSYFFGRNMGEFWWATLWTPWGSGPTGGFMPNQLEKQMQQIKKNHFMTHGMNPQDNGMHSWHSSSSGKIEARCQVRQAGNVR